LLHPRWRQGVPAGRNQHRCDRRACADAAGSALWVHVPEDDDADRAVRGLADHQVLHFRHYGHDSQQDIHIR
jgi:hypothetical protein